MTEYWLGIDIKYHILKFLRLIDTTIVNILKQFGNLEYLYLCSYFFKILFLIRLVIILLISRNISKHLVCN